MSGAGQPPKRPASKRTGTKSREKNAWERLKTDPDILDAVRFLKKVLIGVVKMMVAVIFVGLGALALALVIHQIYAVLEARHIALPKWAHESEVQGTGAVFAILVLLTVVIVVKDAWRVGQEEKEKPDE